MKKENTARICILIAAVVFYGLAVSCFVKGNSSLGAMFMCIGSAFLCLAAVQMNKNKDSKSK